MLALMLSAHVYYFQDLQCGIFKQILTMNMENHEQTNQCDSGATLVHLSQTYCRWSIFQFIF